MSERASRRVWLRYLLLQAPGWAAVALSAEILHRWIGVSRLVGFVVVAVWVLKDFVLFPWVWRAYETSEPEAARRIIGARGTVARRLAPGGWIRVGGELWRATAPAGAVLEPGSEVRVVDVDGLELRVEPLDRANGTRPVNP